YFLLEYFSLKEMLTFYEQKYRDSNFFAVLKSLNYFEDAEEQAEPKMYKMFNWEEAKKRIQHELTMLL
ncbi:MAG TPA: nucleotidyltransferase, partial [Taishania sp.]|nr:nucleotidyltransferase [Taishania sp.]